MEEVLETTRYVVDQSQLVAIDKEAVSNFVRRIKGESGQKPPWDCHYHFCGDKADTVSYLLVLDTLNFCFWPSPGEPLWEIVWESEKVSGYIGLAAALRRAFESGVPLASPDYLIDLTPKTLTGILGAHRSLPLLEERVKNLKELGRLLMSRYEGKAIHLVEAAAQSALGLARLLAQQLISYRDVARYRDRTIYFYKRAQIFAADLHGALGGKGWGNFYDIDRLTAFADYKLPQVLRQLGILRYSEALAKKIDHHRPLEAGCSEEVEIRANTVWAVEIIRRTLTKHGENVNASDIDGMLWSLGQKNDYRKKPYHRTRTIFY